MRRWLGKRLLRAGEALALGYDAGESSRVRRDLGYSRATPRDEDSLITYGDTLELMRLKANDLRRNNAIVAGIGDRIADFVVGAGILPQANTGVESTDRAYEDYFIQWGKRCDSRGRESLWDLQKMAVALRPTHGGMYFELLSGGQIRPIECERIRDPSDTREREGFREGVKVDVASGRVLGYQVHARDANGGFSGKHTERFVDAANMVAVIRPAWRPDSVREIPDLAPIIPTLTDLHEMNTFVLNTAKAQSMVIGVQKKQQGLGMNSAPRGTTTQTIGKRQTWQTDWGQIMEAFPGEDLDLKASPTPGSTHIPYMQLQLGLAAAALNFPYEFLTLDFSKADYSRMKAILLLVNRTARGWRKWLNDRMNQRLWNWVIAKGINNGDVPPAPEVDGVSQWFRVEWQPPEEPWIDRQEAQQADILEVQSCLGSLTAANKRRGQDLADVVDLRIREFKLIQARCAAAGVPVDAIFKMQIPGQTETPTSTRAREDAMTRTTEADDGR